MLTVYERIKSLAHKRLSRLNGYSKISDFDSIIPESIVGKKILGVYINRDKSNIFFAMDGILIESTSNFIVYQDIHK